MTRPYPRLYLPKPYPADWPRKLDFVTPLGLQLSCRAGDLSLYHVIAETSVKAGISRPRDDVQTEFGVLIKHPQDRDKLLFRKDTTLDPTNRRDRVLVPQKEMLDDIVNHYPKLGYVGEFPDIVIKERGVVEEDFFSEQNLKLLEDLPELQASNDLIYFQTSIGNFTKKYRRALGVRRLSDPFYFTRDDIWTAGILPPGRFHPIFRKMRSILRTYTLWTDATGWSAPGKDGITQIEKTCVGRLVNLDLGMPARLIGTVGNTSVSGQIYHLLKHDRYIALEPLDEEI